MEERDRESAGRARLQIEQRRLSPPAFRSALLSVAPVERDAWVNVVLGLGELPDDGPDLPRDCVPYLPCAVDALLRMVDRADVGASDVVVDIGSGVGRAAALVHLLTGASVIGLEVQRGLVLASRELASRLHLSRVSTVEGDAAELTRLPLGSVYFLYCPFGGQRLAKLLDDLEPVARTRMLRIGCVDVPLPARPWLVLEAPLSGDLAVFRTTLHDEGLAAAAPRARSR